MTTNAKLLSETILSLALGLGLSFTLAACATTEKSSAPSTNANDLRKAATATGIADYNDAAIHVTELNFAAGSDALTSLDEAKISKVVDDAEAAGQIKEVKVLSWADQGYPTATAPQPSEGQRSLAKERNREVEDYLKSRDSGLSIDTYNMAERPNMTQDLFKTEDARLKKSLEIAGVSSTDLDDTAKSKSSKALVMVIMKQ